MSAQDFKLIEESLIGRKYGVKNRANITDEDIEAWKYVFSQPGQDRLLTAWLSISYTKYRLSSYCPFYRNNM